MKNGYWKMDVVIRRENATLSTRHLVNSSPGQLVTWSPETEHS